MSVIIMPEKPFEKNESVLHATSSNAVYTWPHSVGLGGKNAY